MSRSKKMKKFTLSGVVPCLYEDCGRKVDGVHDGKIRRVSRHFVRDQRHLEFCPGSLAPVPDVGAFERATGGKS